MAQFYSSEKNAQESTVNNCCQCGRTRDNKGNWQLTDMISTSLLSYGYCPDCSKKFMDASRMLECLELS